MSRLPGRHIAAIFCSFLGARASLGQAPSLVLIDPAPGYAATRAVGMSADGSAVAGYSEDGGYSTFRWTAAGGRQDLPPAPGTAYNSNAISADGSTIVGSTYQPPYFTMIRWTVTGGFEDVGRPSGSMFAYATGVSGDGSILLGRARWEYDPTYSPYVWRGDYQFLDLYNEVDFLAMSRDATVFAGTTRDTSPRAIRWTAASGTQFLVPYPYPVVSSVAAISGDGQVIVGAFYPAPGGAAFRWTQATGLTDLGLPPNASGAQATVVNADGSVIVGSAAVPTGSVLFIWRRSLGYSWFGDEVAANGLAFPAGYSNFQITGVSDDGVVYAGTCGGGSVPERAFVASLPFRAPRTTAYALIHAECRPRSDCLGAPCLNNLPQITLADLAPSGGASGILLRFNGPVVRGPAAQCLHFYAADAYGLPVHPATDYGSETSAEFVVDQGLGYCTGVIVRLLPGQTIPTPGRYIITPTIGADDGILSEQVVGAPSVLDFAYHFLVGPQDSSGNSDSLCGSADFNGDGDVATDADIEAFFACLAGNCCPTCGSADFNGDGDYATDADIEAFFRVLAGGSC